MSGERMLQHVLLNICAEEWSIAMLHATSAHTLFMMAAAAPSDVVFVVLHDVETMVLA